MRFDPAREQSLARAAQLIAFAARRCASRRRLRDQHERQRLGEIESRGRLVEIDQARGADALDVAAVGHQVDVRFQQLALGVAQLQLHRACDLLQFAADAARVQSVHQSRELHRDRRAADARTAGVARQRRARERRRIEPGMAIEVPVLVHQQRVDELLRALRRAASTVGTADRSRASVAAAGPVRRRLQSTMECALPTARAARTERRSPPPSPDDERPAHGDRRHPRISRHRLTAATPPACPPPSVRRRCGRTSPRRKQAARRSCRRSSP